MEHTGDNSLVMGCFFNAFCDEQFTVPYLQGATFSGRDGRDLFREPDGVPGVPGGVSARSGGEVYHGLPAFVWQSR